ncbi:MAG: hypothetical protein GX769_02995 [Erysipelothrix sp.]|nr:hypothetical protein [Erysipelothrix sp.]
MYNEKRKYIFGPLLAGLGAGLGMRANLIFQYVAIGGIIGVTIDLIIKKLMFKSNNDI